MGVTVPFVYAQFRRARSGVETTGRGHIHDDDDDEDANAAGRYSNHPRNSAPATTAHPPKTHAARPFVTHRPRPRSRRAPSSSRSTVPFPSSQSTRSVVASNGARSASPLFRAMTTRGVTQTPHHSMNGMGLSRPRSRARRRSTVDDDVPDRRRERSSVQRHRAVARARVKPLTRAHLSIIHMNGVTARARWTLSE